MHAVCVSNGARAWETLALLSLAAAIESQTTVRTEEHTPGPSLFVIMPNGHRLPYALGVGRNGSHDTPSPLHTSDEEDVWVAKCRWHLLGRWVYKRWRLFVAKRRAHALRGRREWEGERKVDADADVGADVFMGRRILAIERF